MQIECFNLHETEVALFKSAKKLDLDLKLNKRLYPTYSLK